MSGILFDQPAPGATTCIIIGALRGTGGPDFNRYRALLWWVDPAAETPPPARLPRDRTQIARVGASDSDVAQILARFVHLNPRSLPSLVVTDATDGPHADAYQRIVIEAHRLIENTHRARFTRQQDGFIWQKHILQNAPAYAHHRLPVSWAGALRDLPAFVCGSGPSLDVSIAKLAAAADRAVIFSADSALRALARHGVQADFAVSIDLAKAPEKCLAPDVPPARVALASVSPPSWQDAISADRRFFLSGNQLTDDWFAQHGVARTALAVTESCGSTAIELAHYLGCSPIYLFGIDLAVDPANQASRHQKDADPTIYANSRYDPTARLPRVPGNYVETVPSFAFGDWRELDARLAARNDGQIFNVNDRGARLRGTTLVHPDRFTFGASASAKHERLAALTSEPASDPSILSALARLRAVGVRCQQALPNLHRALDKNGPAALAEAFCPLLLDPEIGSALGAFALKLMPHLIPPIEGDRAFWQSLLSEFETLSALANDIAPA